MDPKSCWTKPWLITLATLLASHHNPMRRSVAEELQMLQNLMQLHRIVVPLLLAVVSLLTERHCRLEKPLRLVIEREGQH